MPLPFGLRRCPFRCGRPFIEALVQDHASAHASRPSALPDAWAHASFGGRCGACVRGLASEPLAG